MKTRDHLFSWALSFCVTVVLFAVVPVTGQTGEYDLWCDVNDDGYVGIDDVFAVASHFGGEAGPLDVNKEELLFSSNLQCLPTNAIHASGKWIDEENMLLEIDISQAIGEQRLISVSPNQSVSINLTFQIWCSEGPGITRQAFMLYSWTPTWPPTNETYYYPLYDGGPGDYPGLTITKNFTLTAPSKPGYYFLWFCGATEDDILPATQLCSARPLLPCHCEIVCVDEPSEP